MKLDMQLGIKFVYITAMAVVISLSACGKKKKANDSHPPTAQPTAERVEEVRGNGGLDLPPPVPPDEQAPIPAPPIGDHPGQGDLKEPLDDETGYDPVDPGQIERADVDKRYTGFEDKDGLLYTGSSNDFLLTYLRLRNEDTHLAEEVRGRNHAAAQSIESARLKIDKAAGEVVVSLKIREGHAVKSYVLTGGFEDEGRIANLRLVKGAQNIEGKLKCLDLHKRSCETSYVRLLVGTPGQRAAVAILFRQSLADYKISFSKTPEDPQDVNSEYEHIRAFWKNSVRDIQTGHKLKNIYLNSYEVVHGRSGFEAQILGEGRQLLSFAGPLLAPAEGGSTVKITADRTPHPVGALNHESDHESDHQTLDQYDFTMADLISKAEIVNNNGLGQVRLLVKMRKRGGYEVDSFKLTLMRIIKPTVTPNEENLRM